MDKNIIQPGWRLHGENYFPKLTIKPRKYQLHINKKSVQVSSKSNPAHGKICVKGLEIYQPHAIYDSAN